MTDAMDRLIAAAVVMPSAIHPSVLLSTVEAVVSDLEAENGRLAKSRDALIRELKRTQDVSAMRLYELIGSNAHGFPIGLRDKVKYLTIESDGLRDALDEAGNDLARLTEEVQVGAEVVAGLTREVERLREGLEQVVAIGRERSRHVRRRAIQKAAAAMAGEAEEGT